MIVGEFLGISDQWEVEVGVSGKKELMMLKFGAQRIQLPRGGE
jgi:hypothetical protein